MCSWDQIYTETKNLVKDLIIALIDRERDEAPINRELLRSNIEIFLEIGMGSMDAYENDFEIVMLNDTACYYSRKAASWIEEESPCPEYYKLLKVQECLNREKQPVGHLHASSEEKLLQKLQHELLSKYEDQLLEKEE
ncbi:hypothetical protein R1flu_004477 [Riccia fluitans]|uniref:Cullin N-terminal domain-containing protein n=1 Tax=Riccia fluitans TaxID=41844 RepID=A0ABD1YQN2_9MARC